MLISTAPSNRLVFINSDDALVKARKRKITLSFHNNNNNNNNTDNEDDDELNSLC
jgi:hypothetical protein